ncbi:YeiH family protein [Evansella tamaricis]|uniref:Sulfate exporter family transporter n=1 Tax=Evansella tamaricis TaxID=2069301 RepID=A0ABS6JAP8_9BACI|nr:putative sulfate exporter family transporter [Evansella tamaricis]MBU9710758.1 putative sulfate exporter family transporter [Evansella tamaricis]
MKNKKMFGYIKGITLTACIALLALFLTELPFLSIMGVMIIALIIGVIWNSLLTSTENTRLGITFSSKILLRAGIILMGVRLHLGQIADAGFSILLMDIIVITFTLVVMFGLGKLFKVDRHLTALLAVGTAVCGAAAIVAAASVIKSKKEYTALAVACIAILGTIGAVIYILIYPLLSLNDYEYGVLVGATLHELAHVIAAAVPGGNTSGDSAILVKLGRVALLIPVVILFGFLFSKKGDGQTENKSLPVPWFIFGFLAMTVINTIFHLPEKLVTSLVQLSTFFIAMAMVGLGLSINFKDFKLVGIKPILVAILGFGALVLLGPLLLFLL